MSVTAALDTLAERIQAVFPATRVVRDPGQVVPPCIHIGLPSAVAATLAGSLALDVPVYIVGTSPGDRAGMDPVLDTLHPLMRCIGTREASPVTLEVGETTYPAYRATARIHSKEG